MNKVLTIRIDSDVIEDVLSLLKEDRSRRELTKLFEDKLIDVVEARLIQIEVEEIETMQKYLEEEEK